MELNRYARACSTYYQFLVRGSRLKTSWCHRGFNSLVYRQLSANFMVVTTIFLRATCCLLCFIPIVDYGSYRLSNLEIGLTEGVIDQQGMLTPPWHWSHLWYIQRSVYAHSLICISYRTYEIDYC
jgi:hypothetical protein